MIHSIPVCSALAFCFAIHYTAQAQAPDLDPAFATDGLMVLPDGGLAEFNNAMDHMPNGDLLLTGSAWDVVVYAPLVGALPVWRVAPNGSMVSGWGTNGLVSIDLPDSREEGQKIIAQPDGKVVIGGIRWRADSTQLMFTRLLPNGTLDPTFGTGGFTLLSGIVPNWPGGIPELKGLKELLMDGNGNYIAVGTAPDVGNGHGYVLRLTPAGVLDNTFGTGGVFNYSNSTEERFFGAALLPDGSILCAGVHDNMDNLWVKLTTSGTLDATFGTNGVQISPSANTRGIGSFVRTANGDLYATCYTTTVPAKRVVKFDPSGAVDITFGTDGEVLFSALVLAVSLDAQERVLAWGRDPSGFHFAYILGSTGSTLDYWELYPGSYGAPGANYRMWDFDLDNDGNYVLSGLGFEAGGVYDGWVARVLTTTTGIQDHSLASPLLVWPVPASGALHIAGTADSRYTVEIFDAQGRLVYQQNGLPSMGNSTVTLAIEELTPGPHMLRMRTEDTVRTARFVKQ